MYYRSFLIIIGILLLALATNSYTARNFSHILVKGKILDETTNKPMGVEIEFRDSEGKKIKTQSNSLSGEFQQVLNSNSQYTVILNNSDILRREFKFRTLDTNDYAEQELDWTVIVPKPGAIVFKGQIFDSSSDDLSESGKSKLDELQMLLRFNRELHVDFVVNSQKSISQNNRMQNMEQLINRWAREKPRISLRPAKSKSDNDLVVVITKVKDFIKE